MKINTHGIKMIDLEKASNETRHRPNWAGSRYDIYYDKSTGEVWTRFFTNENEWAVYHDKDVVKVCSTGRYLTPQKIADAIAYELEMEERWGE